MSAASKMADNKIFKTGLVLFCIGRGLSIIESIGLLIYDLIYSFNEQLYGYSNLRTVVFLIISALLTASVIVFAAVTNKRLKANESVRAAAIALSISIAVTLLFVTYGILNNIISDLLVYRFADVSALIAYIAQSLLLTVVSGDLLSIIGGFILFAYGLKKAKK
ncbi:MAG: hypothetical protein IJZ75_07405 [Clostridia bacterium]|nr:hypothetical protein [Clostridia bacterium]